MRIVVMSDSHRHMRGVETIVEQNRMTADLFLHLGDGLEEFEAVRGLFPALAFVGVKGNNDWESRAPKSRLLDCAGKRIWMTHGDLFSVKFGPGALEAEARRQQADVALYGHTHAAAVEYRDGLYLLNPGSVYDSSRTPAGYLVLDITPAGIVPVRREL